VTEPVDLLTVTSRRFPTGPHVLEVAGELDHHTGRLLTRAVEETPFAEHGLVIDLSGMTYCDSTGITVLITAYQRAEALGAPLGLAGVGRDQMRVFEVVGLDQVFTFHGTAEEAAASLRG